MPHLKSKILQSPNSRNEKSPAKSIFLDYSSVVAVGIAAQLGTSALVIHSPVSRLHAYEHLMYARNCSAKQEEIDDWRRQVGVLIYTFVPFV